MTLCRLQRLYTKINFEVSTKYPAKLLQQSSPNQDLIALWKAVHFRRTVFYRKNIPCCHLELQRWTVVNCDM